MVTSNEVKVAQQIKWHTAHFTAQYRRYFTVRAHLYATAEECSDRLGSLLGFSEICTQVRDKIGEEGDALIRKKKRKKERKKRIIFG